MKHRFAGLRPKGESWVEFTSIDSPVARATIAGSRFLVGNPPTRDELKENVKFDFEAFAKKIEGATVISPVRIEADQIGTALLLIACTMGDLGAQRDADTEKVIDDALTYFKAEPPEGADPRLFDISKSELDADDVAGLLRLYVCVKATREADKVWSI